MTRLTAGPATRVIYKPRTWLMIVMAAILLAFSVFVWPTVYRYDHSAGFPVRSNRFTEHTQTCFPDRGWQDTAPN